MRVAAALLLVVAVAGCSKGTSHRTPPTSLPPSSTTTTSTSIPPVQVAKTVNTQDFLVDLETATVQAHQVLMTAQVTNTLTSPQLFDPTMVVTSGGTTYDASAVQTPTISPGGTVAIDLAAHIDDNFSISTALVVFGNVGKNQATVPLGSTGTTDALLDVKLPVPAAVTAGQQVFTFTHAVLSAFQWDGSQLDAGTEELILTMSVKNNDPENSFDIDTSGFRFVNGGETLNGGTVKNAAINAGGTASAVQVYADIDNYKAGGSLTMTIIGADAQQNSVNQTLPIPLPALQ